MFLESRHYFYFERHLSRIALMADPPTATELYLIANQAILDYKCYSRVFILASTWFQREFGFPREEIYKVLKEK